MKLNESNLADPLLLAGGCALGGPPSWGGGGGGPFGGQDLITTTTTNFPDDPLSKLPSSSPGTGVGVELDALLIVQSSDNYAELKPLPPFEYAAATCPQLTLRNDPHLPQMGVVVSSTPPTNHVNRSSNHHHNSSSNSNSNNHSSHGNNAPNNLRGGGSGGSTGGSSIVGSPNGTFSSSSVGGSPSSSLFDAVSSSTTSSLPINIKSELADYLMNSDIDDIAALIGNAIADSTVPNLGIELDPNGVTSSTIDPWTELDAWIESACQQQPPSAQQVRGNGGNGGGILIHGADQDATIHTSADHTFLDGTTSTLQTLLEADSYSGGQGGIFHHPDIKQEFHATSILQSRLTLVSHLLTK